MKFHLTKKGTVPAPPNIFAASANEFENITAELSMKENLGKSQEGESQQVLVPPFMPQFW